jgi:hypothetical protein
MSTPPTNHLRDLGPEAQAMARNCKNERLAMSRHCGNAGVESRLRIARTRPRQVKMTRPANRDSREPSTDGS